MRCSFLPKVAPFPLLHLAGNCVDDACSTLDRERERERAKAGSREENLICRIPALASACLNPDLITMSSTQPPSSSSFGDDDQHLRNLQREYVDLLDDASGGGEGVFTRKVQEMVDGERDRIVLSINEVRRRSPERATALLKDVFTEMVAFRRALR